ncbi:hypothetical protein ACTSKR_04450 [Chitinibacteraceae bacterium HSL-7]
MGKMVRHLLHFSSEHDAQEARTVLMEHPVSSAETLGRDVAVSYRVNELTLETLVAALIERGLAPRGDWYSRLCVACGCYTDCLARDEPQCSQNARTRIWAQHWNAHAHGDHDPTPGELRRQH